MEMLRAGVIYKITSPTGKIYIGKSINLKARISAYKNLGKSTERQKLIYNSIVKHGWENHIIEILCYAYEEYLEELEIQFIKEHNSYCKNNPNGMNLTLGGDGGFGRIISKEQIQKLIKLHTGKKRSLETRKKMSELKKGKIPYCSSLPRSEKQLHHIKYGNIGRKKTQQAIDNEYKSRLNKFLNKYGAVLQYDLHGNLIKEWKILIPQIAKEINIDRSSIYKSIRKGRMAKGCYWKYKNNNQNTPKLNNIE